MVQAWSFAGKYKKETSSLAPGPGQYSSRNHDSVKMKSPTWSIGTAQRGSFKSRALSPGPGMYKTNVDGNNAPKYHFGTKSVTDLDKFKKSVPGPGQYNPASNGFNNNAFSFSGRHDTNNKENMNKPGPGAYATSSTLNKTSGKIGTEKKGNQLVSKLVLENPGPGQYAPGGSDLNRQAAPKYGFGSARRGEDSGVKNKSLLPGPGQYGYANNVKKDAPKYSLTSRRVDTSPLLGKYSPGPGNYNPSDEFAKTSQPKYKFGSSSRKDLRRDAGPAPNAYSSMGIDSRKKSSPSFGFGSSNRPPLSKTTNSPGPGNYKSPSKMLEKNGYYMGQKLAGHKKDDMPGPGNYNPDVSLGKHKSPTCKIGSSPRDQSNKHKDMVPGPGNYKYYNPALDKGPNVKIGTERRGWKIKSDTPGPGDYKIPVKIVDVPRYLIPNPDERYKFV